MSNPPAALSLDLDNLWSYLKTRGDPGWTGFPSYLPKFIPEILEFFEKRRVLLTFFVVGQDAALERNIPALGLLAKSGHEIGNHSFRHEPWLRDYPREEIEAEVRGAEDAIASAAGARPEGFRGPGFSWSPGLLQILADRGYRYDASTLPTSIGPLGRLYYFARTRLAPEDRRRRAGLFGSLADGLRPIKPFNWALPGGKRLLEIPVSTVPWLKTPFHLSYLIYISRFGEGLMRTYLELALGLCRLAGFGPSFLLHPLDFMGPEDAPGLAFFPGMDTNREKKLRLAGTVLDILAEKFDLLPLGRYADRIRGGGKSVPLRPATEKTRGERRGPK